MKGILNVAEVDCEESGELCRREAVDGYPMIFLYVTPNEGTIFQPFTLSSYQNGHRLDYRGGRKLPDLEAYARRITAAATYDSSFERCAPCN